MGLFCFCGCSAKESADRSERAVEEFHSLFNAGKFDSIRSNATEDFRQAGPKSEYDEFMAAVRRKMGRARKSTRESWNVMVTTKGTRVALAYKTEFEHGNAQEHFTFIDEGSGPELLAYRINSNALVTR